MQNKILISAYNAVNTCYKLVMRYGREQPNTAFIYNVYSNNSENDEITLHLFHRFPYSVEENKSHN